MSSMGLAASNPCLMIDCPRGEVSSQQKSCSA